MARVLEVMHDFRRVRRKPGRKALYVVSGEVFAFFVRHRQVIALQRRYRETDPNRHVMQGIDTVG